MQLFLLAREDGFNLIKAEPARVRDKNVAGLQATDATPFTGPGPGQCDAPLFSQPTQPALSRKDVST